MATTLALLRDRVEVILADTGNAIWVAGDVDEGIRRALHEYSKVRPLESISTVAITADGREVDVSALTGILGVSEIWCDYTASDPEFPANKRVFEYWPDSETIYVTDDYEPQNGDVMRVFYGVGQTLDGLDTETTTSFPLDDETLIAGGAAGYAATSRAVDLAEQVTLDRLTAQQIRAWGMAKLQRFRAGLGAVAREAAMRGDARAPLGPLDAWEGEWA